MSQLLLKLRSTGWRALRFLPWVMSICLGGIFLTPPTSWAAPPLVLDETPQLLEPRESLSELEQDRLHALSLYGVGHVQEQRGEKSAALRSYQRAFRYDQRSATALRDLLRLSAELDRYEQSVQYALLAVDKIPLGTDILRPLAMVLVRQGDWQQALRLYEVILRDLKPDQVDFTSLTIRQEAGRLFYLTDRLAEGSAISTPVEAALANPKQLGLTENQHKELLGEGGLTYHLFAECHLAAGDLAAARTAFEMAHKYQPSPGLYGYNLARVNHRAGETAAALSSLQAYFEAKLGSEGAAPYELLVELLKATEMAKSIEESVAKTLGKLRASDPENSALTLFVAQRHLRANEFALAEPLFAELAVRDKKRTREAVQRGLVRCQIELKHAEMLLNTLSQIDASLLQELLPEIVANVELNQELWKLAAARRATPAEKLPPVGEAWVMAQLALVEQDTVKAQMYFSYSLQDQPQKSLELVAAFSMKLIRSGQPQLAIKLLRTHLEREKAAQNRTDLRRLLVGALSLNQQFDEALTLAREIQQTTSDQEIPDSQVADILWQAKRNAEAEQAYLKLLAAWEEHPDAESIRRLSAKVRQALSHLCVQRGALSQAEQWLEEILDDYPTHAGALNDLSYLWADQQKHFQRSLRMIVQALEQEPTNRAYLDTLGWVQYRLGNYPAAKDALLQAIEGDEQPDSVVLEHLGDVCWELGEIDSAHRHWQQSLDGLAEEDKTPRRAELQRKIMRTNQPLP